MKFLTMAQSSSMVDVDLTAGSASLAEGTASLKEFVGARVVRGPDWNWAKQDGMEKKQRTFMYIIIYN